MSKHTTGPWRVSGKHVNGAVVIRGAESTSEIAVVLQNDTRYQAEDHARLIAAAPDLLEALKVASAMLHGLPKSLGYDFDCRQFDAAIAKATGEA